MIHELGETKETEAERVLENLDTKSRSKEVEVEEGGGRGRRKQ
jgi:hypothetical protein